MLWGPSLHDWAQETGEERWTNVTARAGDIVLGHDGIAGVLDGVVTLFRQLIDRAQWAGEVLEHYRAQVSPRPHCQRGR